MSHFHPCWLVLTRSMTDVIWSELCAGSLQVAVAAVIEVSLFCDPRITDFVCHLSDNVLVYITWTYRTTLRKTCTSTFEPSNQTNLSTCNQHNDVLFLMSATSVKTIQVHSSVIYNHSKSITNCVLKISIEIEPHTRVLLTYWRDVSRAGPRKHTPLDTHICGHRCVVQKANLQL